MIGDGGPTVFDQQQRRRDDAALVAAHELRHDVRVARDLLEQVRATDRDEADRRALGDQLGESLLRLERDIEQLLLDGGGDLDRLERRPTNLGQLVMRVVRAHPSGSQPLEVSAPPVVFNLDPVKVERILDNLLANALVHTPDTCPVRVEVSVEPGGATLSVEDEGPGLPDAKRRVLRAVGDEPPDGDGVGLWIVRRFARLHGGELRIEEPTSGRGARFVVWLPAQGQAR